jgi:NCS1 family nucleobase:cation symporter-1
MASQAADLELSQALKVEQRGIELVSDKERWGRPSSLFWMWAGGVWNVEFVVYGAVMVVFFGLSFAQALLVIILGNLFYVLTGLASLPGPLSGTTAFGTSRAPFGPNGNRMPSLFNWITQVGFETEGIALVVFAGIALATKAGFAAGDPLKIVLIIAAVLIQGIVPFLGHGAVLKALRYLTVPFVLLFVIMAGLTASKANLTAVHHGAGWGSVMVGLALVISVGGLGWTENASDYSRYLPRNSNKKSIVGAVALGAGIPSLLLEVLGAAIATGVPAAANSPTGLLGSFTPWFAWPFLILTIFQLFAINTIDLYSSGVTLQSLGLPLKRIHCVLIDTVVAGGLAGYAVFSGNFYGYLTAFLLFIIIWLGPWCAIFLIDYFLRRGRYDPPSLMNMKGGRYYRNGGIHWPAVIAQVIGMVAAFMWLNATNTTALTWTSPLSKHFSGSDFSVFMGLFFGGVTYYVLAARKVRAEGAATPASMPIPAAREPGTTVGDTVGTTG